MAAPQFTSSTSVCGILSYEVSKTNFDPVVKPATGFVNEPVGGWIHPQDPSAKNTYEFYVKATADGGAFAYSKK